MSISNHEFEFTARMIATAASEKAKYHREREIFWKSEYDDAVNIVENTIGAKVVRQPVTNGYTVEVAIDYGDKSAYTHMRRSFDKLNEHIEKAETYESDAYVYGSMPAHRVYSLSRADVEYFGLGDKPKGGDAS
jgi:hypothetical protein